MRILYLDIDTTRPDHLSCYGYRRKTSPNLDRIAAEGVRLNNCYASDVPCLPSRNALFSGRFGINSGVVNHGGINADPRPEGSNRRFRSVAQDEALAECLRNAGWRTASISPFPHRHTAYQIWYGFHEMYDTGGNGGEKAHTVYPFVERWLQTNAHNDHWFLHVNFWDPHTAYDVPLDYGNPFKDDAAPAWMTQQIIDAQRKSYGQHDAVRPHSFPASRKCTWPRGAETIANLKDYKDWIDGYDVGIHYADNHVGKIIARLKELGIYDDTAIIMSSDHGENQGELEIWGDHQTADQCTSNIPLIIRWPGLTDAQAGKALPGLVYNVDFGATLLELCGGKQPQVWDGISFAQALKSGAHFGREYLVLSQCAWSCQRSVRWKDHILIRTYDTGWKNFPSLMLFDLKQDVHQTRNLVATRPELVGEGLKLLDGWVAENLQKSGQPDPLFQVIAEGGPLHPRESRQNMLATLRATGRGEHADWLEKNGGRPREQ